MDGFLLQLGVWTAIAFFVAVFLAAQERWGAIKCLVLGVAFPVTLPVILYFLGRKWWVNRKRLREYKRQSDITQQINDTYVPKDHVEVNPNFTDVDPFASTEALNAAYDPSIDVGELEDFEPDEMDAPYFQTASDMEEIQEQIADLGGTYICPFHRKYPNVPFSGCTCHK